MNRRADVADGLASESSLEVDWESVLDLYEASLAHHAAVATRRGVEGENPWPPANLPTTAMPVALRARAEQLLRESHVLIDGMAGELASLPTLVRAQRARSHRRETPDAARWSVSL